MKYFDKDLQINIKNIPKGSLLLDIETTGLKIETTNLYLFGCMYEVSEGNWHFKQWLLESPDEEKSALSEINEFAAHFSTLVHFNGDRFDLPYLDYHATQAGISSCFLSLPSFDLYKKLKVLKTFLNLPSAKQKDFETFIGNNREDKYNGGELIDVYHEYVKSKDEELLNLLLLHNREDVIGMSGLFKLIPYSRFYENESIIVNNPPKVINDYALDDSLMLQFDLGSDYQYDCTNVTSDCYIALRNGKLNIKLPVINGTLNYFYPHPRDYYYLKDEDMIIHKSVAKFVDESHKEKVSPEDCFVKQNGSFARILSSHGYKVFRQAMGSTPYVLIDDDFLNDTKLMNMIIHDILDELKKQNYKKCNSV